MSRAHRGAAGGFLFLIMCLPASVAAQTPAYVRVVEEPGRIQRWYRQPVTDVMLEVAAGTTLEVLDKENDWLWVVVPADAHGTRRAGWIRARSVEAAPAPVVARRAGRGAPADLASPTPAVAPAEDEGRVTITERPADASAPARTYAFEDVHFDRDRASLRPEDLARLDAVAHALKEDPALVLNLEGYTCNLGGTSYNLALGLRRANTVKEYLVGQGVPAERLHAVSLGEDHAKHDNAHEETRQLNRRVAVVPNTQP